MRLSEFLNEAIAEPLFDVEGAKKIAADLNKKIKAPFVKTEVSMLGGERNVSIILKVSLDPKKEWANGIFQNSRYFMIDISRPNILELFSKHFELPKFRKARAKNIDDIYKKINAYIEKAK